MGHRLRGTFEQVELREWHEMGTGEAATLIPDACFAGAFLRDLARGPFEMTELRRALERSLTTFSARDFSDDQVIEQLARLLVAGRLVLVPIRPFDAGTVRGAAEAPLPPAQSAPAADIGLDFSAA